MNRQEMIQQLEDVAEWDIVIIGGGATGLGAAVDAASRGYKTLLVEQSDFSKGSSSRSTKLVHGGVRYLAQGNLKLVKEALKERGLLLKNAPHVCHNLSFIIPAFHWGQKWYYGIGLHMYSLMAGKLSLGKTSVLSKQLTQQLLPSLDADKLTGGVQYQDGQFDDARLAVNLAQTAEKLGAAVINYCKVTSLTKINKHISGLVVQDVLSAKKYAINCKAIINATGVFADGIMRMNDPQHKPVIAPSQGIHLVVDKHFFPGEHALMIPSTDDGRVLFAVPWHDKVLLGTTDTPIKNIDLEPVPLQTEIDFVIKHINRYFTTLISYSDVRSVYVGLRPLIKVKSQKNTSILPRDHTTIVADSGLVTVTGGKWTTYRTMGKHAVDSAAIAGKLPIRDCITASLIIHGYTEHKHTNNSMAVYGSDAEKIDQLINEQPVLAQKINIALPYTKAMVVWAVQNEMAMSVEDVLARRTRALILDAKAAITAAPIVASLMANLLQKSEEWQQWQVKDFTTLAQKYLIQ